MRILLVEDDKVLADALSRALVQSAHAVDNVSTGEEADHALSLAIYDLAILDIGLPGKDGYEIAREVRQMEAEEPLGGITLIALSGYGRRQDLDLSREAGFDHHLVKPVELEQLLKLIRAPDAAALA